MNQAKAALVVIHSSPDWLDGIGEAEQAETPLLVDCFKDIGVNDCYRPYLVSFAFTVTLSTTTESLASFLARFVRWIDSCRGM